MANVDVLTGALWTIELLLLLCLAVLFGHGLFIALLTRLRESHLDRGYQALYRLIQPTTSDSAATERADREALGRMSHSLQEALILPLARNLDRSACAPLRAVAEQIGMVGRAEARCRSRWWSRRLRAARTLTALYAGESVMPILLRDPHPAVRAQAAEWVAANPRDDTVPSLVAMAADRSMLSRFSAQDALLRLGWLAVEPLARHIESHHDDDVEAVLGVAAAMPHPAFVEAAIGHCTSRVPSVRARALDLLGAVGGASGASRATRHLDDPDAQVRTAAAVALGRMGHWPQANALADRMRDPSWNVRRASALSLRALGSPGVLMLRRMTADGNAFAADMARHVLDLPDGVDEVVA